MTHLFRKKILLILTVIINVLSVIAITSSEEKIILNQNNNKKEQLLIQHKMKLDFIKRMDKSMSVKGILNGNEEDIINKNDDLKRQLFSNMRPINKINKNKNDLFLKSTTRTTPITPVASKRKKTTKQPKQEKPTGTFNKRQLNDAAADDDAAVANDDANNNNDDAANNNDDAANNNNNDGEGQGYFDITEYAFKYVGCSDVKRFDDNKAAEADNNNNNNNNNVDDDNDDGNQNDDDVYNNNNNNKQKQYDNSATIFTTDKFVMFRLCPADECSSYSEKGCSYSYGEYVIDMGSYMQIVTDYHLSRYEDYCEVCMDCMSGGNGNNNNNGDDDGGNGDDYYNDDYNGDDDNFNRNRRRRLNDDDDGADNYDDDGNDGNNYGDDAVGNNNNNNINNNACEFYDSCLHYDKICYDYYDLVNNDNEDLFECGEIKQGDDDQVSYYVGPHCDSSGRITLGMFNDNTCTNYIDKDYFNDVLGYDNHNGMDFFSSESCISCLNGDNLYIDENVDDDEVGNQPYDFCTYLYQDAAKCHKYMSAVTYGDEWQYEEENLVCSFVESLVSGTYNEYGEIIIESPNFNYSNWYNVNEYTKITKKVTIGQGIGLIISIMLCISLLIYAMYLHRKITLRKEIFGVSKSQWDTSTKMFNRDLSRASSGIRYGRSTSTSGSQDYSGYTEG